MKTKKNELSSNFFKGLFKETFRLTAGLNPDHLMGLFKQEFKTKKFIINQFDIQIISKTNDCIEVRTKHHNQFKKPVTSKLLFRDIDSQNCIEVYIKPNPIFIVLIFTHFVMPLLIVTIGIPFWQSDLIYILYPLALLALVILALSAWDGKRRLLKTISKILRQVDKKGANLKLVHND